MEKQSEALWHAMIIRTWADVGYKHGVEIGGRGLADIVKWMDEEIIPVLKANAGDDGGSHCPE